jgi:hypothetical protein
MPVLRLHVYSRTVCVSQDHIIGLVRTYHPLPALKSLGLMHASDVKSGIDKVTCVEIDLQARAPKSAQQYMKEKMKDGFEREPSSKVLASRVFDGPNVKQPIGEMYREYLVSCRMVACSLPCRWRVLIQSCGPLFLCQHERFVVHGHGQKMEEFFRPPMICALSVKDLITESMLIADENGDPVSNKFVSADLDEMHRLLPGKLVTFDECVCYSKHAAAAAS